MMIHRKTTYIRLICLKLLKNSFINRPQPRAVFFYNLAVLEVRAVIEHIDI